MRIKKLPMFIANQIAAGEVVERPSSILKELLENSIDANSTSIDVEIRNGGINFIRVTDNGVGIFKEDLSLACVQHATSKILNIGDLEGIKSLGFRGEALASIGSVSKFEIISKPKEQKNAWKINFEENNFHIQPASHNNGTTAIMRDLFFNTPARRNFLRTEKTEYYHLEEIFKRIVLSNFNIAFSFTHNDKQVFKLPKILNEQDKIFRVAKVFGRSFIDRSVYIESKQNDLQLFGWMIIPEYAKAQAVNQYFYVNNRVIKDKLINHAIRQVYQQIGEIGKNPNYCLFLQVNVKDVDVNVHPTKHEVRFKHARLVHQFILDSILEALNKAVDFAGSSAGKFLTDSCKIYNKDRDKGRDRNIDKDKEKNKDKTKNINVFSNVQQTFDSFVKQDDFQKNKAKVLERNIYVKNKENAKETKIFEEQRKSNVSFDKSNGEEFLKKLNDESNNNNKYNRSNNSDLIVTKNYENDIVSNKKIKLLHTLENKIAIILIDEKLIFIDLKKAIFNFVYKKLNFEHDKMKKINSRALLFPKTFFLQNLNEKFEKKYLFNDFITYFLNLGFDLEILPSDEIIIRKIPFVLSEYKINIENLIKDLMNYYFKKNINKNGYQKFFTKNVQQETFKIIAKISSINNKLQDKEVLNVLSEIFKNNYKGKAFLLDVIDDVQEYKVVSVEDLYKIM